MSSFLGLGGKGIWCSDSSFQTWCGLLAEALPRTCNAPWCAEYAAHLVKEAKSPHRGYLNFGLYQAIGEDDGRRAVLVAASQAAMLELVKNPELPLERLRRLPVGEGVVWLSPLKTERMLRLAVAFLLLLNGAWPDDEFTSPQF